MGFSDDMIRQYKHPLLFYLLATAIPWFLWYLAGYFSHLEPQTEGDVLLTSILGFLGLLAPMAIAFWLIFRNPRLRDDFLGRIFNFSASSPIYYLLSVFLMLASILAAQGISLLFGYPASQFALARHFSFVSGVFPVWFLLIAAPAIEELAWHSYGTDCLRSRFNLLNTSLIFALFWGIWHIPLSWIRDYYQARVVESGWIFGANFLISIFPFVIIMNWLYYKTGRNIVVPIVFHVSAGFFNEIFAPDPASKVIQTGLLIVVSIIIIARERAFFFSRETVF